MTLLAPARPTTWPLTPDPQHTGQAIINPMPGVMSRLHPYNSPGLRRAYFAWIHRCWRCLINPYHG